jgi:hypothetical protein
MFNELINFFGVKEEIKEEAENDILRRKLKRIQANRNISSVAKSVEPAIPAIGHKRLISHWTDCSQLDIERRFYEVEPHVVQILNNSTNLMQPGSAEMFQTCRPHPLDELNERRRKAEELDATRRFFQYSKLVKSSA